MTRAELLHALIEDGRLYRFRPDMRLFHALFPSTFHNGAFIFEDGSIWWAR